MDSIYRRNRIRLPKLMISQYGKDPKKVNKIGKFFLIFLVAIVTFTGILKSIDPIYEKLCQDKAKSIATIICNEESTKVIQTYKYEDLITIYRDKEDNITMLKSNITPINFIISDVGEKIQKRLNEVRSEQTSITLGSFTGSKILSGLGPNIPLKLSLVGNVETDLRSQFEAQGINQTIHRIYLQVDCKVSVLTPYKTIEENISNQVLIAENVIVGKIPEAYYNLQGLTKDNAVDIIQ